MEDLSEGSVEKEEYLCPCFWCQGRSVVYKGQGGGWMCSKKAYLVCAVPFLLFYGIHGNKKEVWLSMTTYMFRHVGGSFLFELCVASFHYIAS